jgi:hypothetical protein
MGGWFAWLKSWADSSCPSGRKADLESNAGFATSIDEAFEFGVLEEHDRLSILDFASVNHLERVVQSEF